MRFFLFLLIFIFLSINQAASGELKEIELMDGSIILGEIVSISNDVYLIKSTSLGDFEINNSQISSINPIEFSKEQYQALQKKMLDDKEIMEIILSLKNDPDVNNVLNNPDIMDDINSGNIGDLISNPAFMKLLKKPEFREIRRMVIQPN